MRALFGSRMISWRALPASLHVFDEAVGVTPLEFACLVEDLHLLVAEFERGGLKIVVELLHVACDKDYRDDCGFAQQPSEGYLGGVLSS